MLAETGYRQLKQRNAQLNLAEMRQGQTEVSSLPRYVMVELSQGCNLRCPMCRSRPIGYQDRDMHRDTFRLVADLLFPAAEMVDIRGWGESLLVPDVQAVISMVERYEARCRVVTNLSLNRPQVVEQLIHINAMIDVSFDAVRQEVLDRCRPGSRFKLIDNNIRTITDGLRERHGSAQALRLLCTVQRETLSSLPEVVSYAAQVGAPTIVLNEVTLAPGDPAALTGMDAEVDEIVGQAAALAADLGVGLFAGTRFGTRVGLRKEIPFCLHPWSYATIGYDGSVGFCDHLIGPMMDFYCMGDVTTEDFLAVWNGPRWQALRSWHASGHSAVDERYRACLQCYQHRNVDFEDVFEPRLTRYRLPSGRGQH